MGVCDEVCVSNFMYVCVYGGGRCLAELFGVKHIDIM